jgi:hypothetical protein
LLDCSAIQFLVYHQIQMRRALSIFLVLFFSLGPLAATLGASEDTRLPACCRRLGAHHCAMSIGEAARPAEVAGGQTIVRAPSTCPAFPGATAATTSGPHALTSTPVGLPVLLAQTHSPAARRAIAKISQIRTRSGRAPPASLLA